ncbi:hypothetical protein BDF14DRAFT_1788305 [Spinellus fusiger]|nr:hypothetical protein BDF14DRAFT_1788305 [Spinellus fusiger]
MSQGQPQVSPISLFYSSFSFLFLMINSLARTPREDTLKAKPDIPWMLKPQAAFNPMLTRTIATKGSRLVLLLLLLPVMSSPKRNKPTRPESV